jgi:hypothetical protein
MTESSGRSRIVVTEGTAGTEVIREPVEVSIDTPRARISDVWLTERQGALRDFPPGDSPWALAPSELGAVWRIVEFKPDPAPADITAGMHETPTVDLGVVLSGSVDLVLDDSRVVRLTAGDHVILRGSRHTWVNRGPETCVLSFLLIHRGSDAKARR